MFADFLGSCENLCFLSHTGEATFCATFVKLELLLFQHLVTLKLVTKPNNRKERRLAKHKDGTICLLAQKLLRNTLIKNVKSLPKWLKPYSATRLGHFWKVLWTNFLTRVAKLFVKFLGCFDKHHVLNKNCFQSFLGQTFEVNLASFFKASGHAEAKL